MEISYDLMKRVNVYDLNKLEEATFSKLPSSFDDKQKENW